MKKIKSKKQLQSEKRRIQWHLEEVENRIRSNWQDLKSTLKPSNVAKEALSRVIARRTADNLDGGGILKDTLTYGVSLVARRFMDRAGGKLGHFFRR